VKQVASVPVSVLHDDDSGRIIAIGRVAEGIEATMLSGDGRSVFETNVEEDGIDDVVNNYRVDVTRKALVRY
jgi:hypothetical protein